ncbi:hypothetical protein ACJX0J_013154 [Zea mays]
MSAQCINNMYDANSNIIIKTGNGVKGHISFFLFGSLAPKFDPLGTELEFETEGMLPVFSFGLSEVGPYAFTMPTCNNCLNALLQSVVLVIQQVLYRHGHSMEIFVFVPVFALSLYEVLEEDFASQFFGTIVESFDVSEEWMILSMEIFAPVFALSDFASQFFWDNG